MPHGSHVFTFLELVLEGETLNEKIILAQNQGISLPGHYHLTDNSDGFQGLTSFFFNPGLTSVYEIFRGNIGHSQIDTLNLHRQ